MSTHTETPAGVTLEGLEQAPQFRNSKQLKVARAAAGLSQKDLADLVFSNRVTIAKIETETPIRSAKKSQTLRLVSRVLLSYPHINLDKDGNLHVKII